MILTTEWIWRSRDPAKCPPSDDHPYGIALDLAGGAPSCTKELQYPAPGVGTWIVRCETCGYSAAVSAAGRTDDPTKIKIPCKTGRPQ